MSRRRVQTIYIPAGCPDCDGPVCVTDLEPPRGTAHCHDPRQEVSCGWVMEFEMVPDVDSYTIVSVDLADPEMMIIARDRE